MNSEMKSAEELAKERIPNNWFESDRLCESIRGLAADMAKDYARQALQIAAEEAQTDVQVHGYDMPSERVRVDKSSILNIELP